jgi:hypothetical protein
MAEDESTETEDVTETATETETTDSATEKPDNLGDAGKQAIDRMKAERDAARKEAKTHQRELEKLRTASLSEQERAVAEAKTTGAQEATLAAGKRLARAEIRAASASAGFDATDLLDDLDLSRFVGDDGEPDEKAIADRVKKWSAMAPKSTRPSGHIDQGPRTTSSPSEQIAAAEAKGDWKASLALKAQQLQALKS